MLTTFKGRNADTQSSAAMTPSTQRSAVVAAEEEVREERSLQQASPSISELLTLKRVTSSTTPRHEAFRPQPSTPRPPVFYQDSLLLVSIQTNPHYHHSHTLKMRYALLAIPILLAAMYGLKTKTGTVSCIRCAGSQVS